MASCKSLLLMCTLNMGKNFTKMMQICHYMWSSELTIVMLEFHTRGC